MRHVWALRRSGTGAYSTQVAAEWLAQFTNYERQGVPAAAGTDTSAGFDLGRMHRLLAALGEPHLRWPAVHVAGTKGKGSTSAMLSAMLQQADYRVGTYTSPHVASFTERLAIDCQPIPSSALDELVARYAPTIETAQQAEHGALSHFEVVTALAFTHFAEQHVDVAVVEVGLGGVRDATNVFSPQSLAAAVITAVGVDHAAALGGAIEQIAAAKAGIMKQGRPVVLARQPEATTQQVLLGRAAELGCRVVDAPAEVQLVSEGIEALPGGSLRHRCLLRLTGQRSLTAFAGGSLAPAAAAAGAAADGGAAAAAGTGEAPAAAAAASGSEVQLRLIGAHQLDNAAAAVAAAAVLKGQGFERLSLPAVVAGLEAATLPGRFQVCRFADETQASEAAPEAAVAEAAAASRISSSSAGGEGGSRSVSSSEGPVVVLDGAHTPEAAAALAAALRAAYPTAPVALILAMAEDKDIRQVCSELRQLAPAVAVFTQVAIAGGRARAAGPGQLAAAWQAAAILGGGRRKGGMRTRELIQASLPAAVEAARRELRARIATEGGSSSNSSSSSGGTTEPPGVVLVTGSLHAVGAALRQLDLQPV